MKTPIIFFLALFSLSSCILEIEMDPPYVSVGNIDEYETKEVIHEVWLGGVLIHEEVVYTAWLDMDFFNRGGIRAEDVWAEITFYDGHRDIKTISIDLPNLRAGSTYSFTLDTGFNSMYDYTDYDVNVYWE